MSELVSQETDLGSIIQALTHMVCHEFCKEFRGEGEKKASDLIDVLYKKKQMHFSDFHLVFHCPELWVTFCSWSPGDHDCN